MPLVEKEVEVCPDYSADRFHAFLHERLERLQSIDVCSIGWVSQGKAPRDKERTTPNAEAFHMPIFCISQTSHRRETRIRSL